MALYQGDDGRYGIVLSQKNHIILPSYIMKTPHCMSSGSFCWYDNGIINISRPLKSDDKEIIIQKCVLMPDVLSLGSSNGILYCITKTEIGILGNTMVRYKKPTQEPELALVVLNPYECIVLYKNSSCRLTTYGVKYESFPTPSEGTTHIITYCPNLVLRSIEIAKYREPLLGKNCTIYDLDLPDIMLIRNDTRVIIKKIIRGIEYAILNERTLEIHCSSGIYIGDVDDLEWYQFR